MTLSVVDAAREEPDAIALRHAGASVSWAERAARALGAVAWLRARGIGGGRAEPSAPVALTAEATPAFVAWLDALLLLGVPALLVHPRLVEAERAALLARARPSLVVASDVEPPPAVRTPHDVPRALSPELPALIVTTSGSTGEPRGVVLSRRAIEASASASAAHLGWEADDRWLLAMPPAHVGGVSVLIRCLTGRRTAVLAPPAGGPRLPPAALARLLEDERITLASLVPSQLRLLLELEPRWAPVRALRAVLLGGAAAPPALLADARARGVPVLTTYGLTEAASQVTTERPGEAPLGPRGAGVPLPGVELRVVGGRILVRGPTLLSGHWPPDAASPLDGDGWLDTGDLGHLDAGGALHVTGRASERIVSGGENIHPAEVERALLEHHAVEEACAVGVPDEAWGERVVAVVTLRAGRQAAPEELCAFAATRLAGYKRPRRVIVTAALPRTTTGKVHRAAVRSALAPPLG
ncbi:MAG: long-chain fatty acid--CoA ligase [Polyangiaceae bacterium]|nr:long-chain fatty acid--CoA ligase [Polyangiaceae bacterium]